MQNNANKNNSKDLTKNKNKSSEKNKQNYIENKDNNNKLSMLSPKTQSEENNIKIKESDSKK